MNTRFRSNLARLELFGLMMIALLVAALPAMAQDATNSPPWEQPWSADSTNGAPVISSPIWQFVTADSTNWYCGAGVTYDDTDKSGGGWAGVGYQLSTYVVPIIRVDVLKRGVFVPSGNLQFQVPVKLFGRIETTPFAFTGIATSINNPGDSGNAIGVFGTGLIIKFNSSSPYIPDGIIGDYERWTGGGFNNNQIRLGPFWGF